MASIVSWLLAKLRNRRYAIQNRTARNQLIFGTIYKMRLYENWKHDISPLIFVMYSGPMTFVKKSGHYTDGLNLNYMNSGDKQWLGRVIYLMKKGNQVMNGRLFYRYLKMNRPSIIRTCYRRYFTSKIRRPQMVSAGVTNLTKLVYPFNDVFITRLNQLLEPTELRYTQVDVAYSQTELQERIQASQNQRNIKDLRTQPTNTIGSAPWIKKV
ncbi:MAG: hypothetical protein ACOC1O_00920 [bacterium]